MNSIPTGMPANPMAGMIYFDPIMCVMHVFDGQKWVNIRVDNPVRCVICGSVSHQLERVGEKLLIPDHPFCANNLEFLEHKLEQKERVRLRLRP